MSKIDLVIDERTANIGKFSVGRLLPFRQKRMVGPFIYIDHIGPVELNENENFDVLPHPHIGLSTLTYLFDGSIMHRDTLGNEIEIMPGEVNLMTAGKWIVHSERTPEYLRQSKLSMHGLQIWIALPKKLEQMNPEFSHIEKEQIPSWTSGDLQFKLIAGEAFEKKSPVPVYSKLFMIEIKSYSEQFLDIGKHIYGESGLYILNGSIECDKNIYNSKKLLITKDSSSLQFTIAKNSTIFIFGGLAFPEERLIEWNFVSSDKELIEKAKQKWKTQTFPKIKGDEIEFIPYK